MSEKENIESFRGLFSRISVIAFVYLRLSEMSSRAKTDVVSYSCSVLCAIDQDI